MPDTLRRQSSRTLSAKRMLTLVLIAPPEVIATFPKPNYVHPETHGPALMVIAPMLSAIAALVVAARLYARFYITRAARIDDALIVGALVFGIALSALVMVGNQVYYNGYHVWVSQQRFPPLL